MILLCESKFWTFHVHLVKSEMPSNIVMHRYQTGIALENFVQSTLHNAAAMEYTTPSQTNSSSAQLSCGTALEWLPTRPGILAPIQDDQDAIPASKQMNQVRLKAVCRGDTLKCGWVRKGYRKVDLPALMEPPTLVLCENLCSGDPRLFRQVEESMRAEAVGRTIGGMGTMLIVMATVV